MIFVYSMLILAIAPIFAFFCYKHTQLVRVFQELLVIKSKLEAENQFLKENLAKLEANHLEYKDLSTALKIENNALQNDLNLKIQSNHEFEKRVSDFEKSRQESLTQAKAAVFETASQLSNQLLEQHKKHTVESQAEVNTIAQNLHEKFASVLNSVHTLNEQVNTSKEAVNTITNALMTPQKIGTLSELTLENILKTSELVEGRDYILQYEFKTDAKNSLRPDAVVFLPNNNLMVIDSKASIFFLELGAAVTEDEIKAAKEGLKSSMQKHLTTLSSKEYGAHLKEHFKKRDINTISNVMFLPSEIALEKVSQVDPTFLYKAWAKHIYPVGPTGLIHLLLYAKFHISSHKQSENSQLIIDEIQKLMTSVATLYQHAKKVGDNLYSATNSFDKFAGSFNTNFLSKVKHMKKLGVSPDKALDARLDRLTVIHSAQEVIDVEPVDQDDAAQLSSKENIES